jgi:hypothetical protein
MVQGVQAQHAIEDGIAKRQACPWLRRKRLHLETPDGYRPPAADVPSHHLERQICSNSANADAGKKFGRPARAGGEVQDTVVRRGAAHRR